MAEGVDVKPPVAPIEALKPKVPDAAFNKGIDSLRRAVEQNAADKAEQDLKDKGAGDALEGLAGEDLGKEGEKDKKDSSQAQGEEEQAQEQPHQPETQEEQIVRLQEQVAKLTEQNQKLSEDVGQLAQGLKGFLEKSEAEEQDPQKKLKYQNLLLLIAALGIETVVQGSKNVTD